MWLVVLSRLGEAYPPPGSRIGELSSDARASMAGTWADELGDVPVEAILKLHGRVMKARKAPYCPNVGDYRAAWNDWDYWAEVNAAEPNEYLALPAAMEKSDTPRFVRLFQECGPVMCNCEETVSSNGVFVYPAMAQLMTVGELMELGRDGDYKGLDFTAFGGYQDRSAKGLPCYWVCATGKCDFCVDANRLDEVLPRKRQRDGEGFSAVSAVIASIGHAPRVSTPKPCASATETVTTPDISDDELIDALAACGVHIEKIGRERALEFGRHIIAQVGIAGLNERDAKTLWPEFKASRKQEAVSL